MEDHISKRIYRKNEKIFLFLPKKKMGWYSNYEVNIEFTNSMCFKIFEYLMKMEEEEKHVKYDKYHYPDNSDEECVSEKDEGEECVSEENVPEKHSSLYPINNDLFNCAYSLGGNSRGFNAVLADPKVAKAIKDIKWLFSDVEFDKKSLKVNISWEEKRNGISFVVDLFQNLITAIPCLYSKLTVIGNGGDWEVYSQSGCGKFVLEAFGYKDDE